MSIFICAVDARDAVRLTPADSSRDTYRKELNDLQNLINSVNGDGGAVVSIQACGACDPGPNPGRGPYEMVI